MRWSAIFFILFFSLAGAAQISSTGPETLYNGQNVTAIDLIANPHRDVEPLRSQITQKAGQPYAQADVQASIDALQREGKFEKVEVNVIPEISGLRLNFILEPAYYMGNVDFEGVAKSFTYSRLLQVVNLQEEDPYDQARLPVAQKALLDFFHHNGYFQAQVECKIQIDDANQLVNISFFAQMGKQARIGNVQVRGTDDREQAWVLHKLRSLRARFTGALLKPGRAYTPERIKAATTLIKKTLAHQHYLVSKVHETPPQYHADTNRVDVAFEVEIGPVVVVKMTGARLTKIPFLSGREMRKLIPIYSEGAIDQDLVQEGQQNLTNYFQNKGFFDVQVTPNFQEQPNQIVLEYKIDQGAKHKVDRISFHGNYQIPEKDLLPLVSVKRSHIWTHGNLSQKLLKQSVDNLQAYYRDHGYEEVKITSQVTEHQPKIDVAFEIQEGPQTLVDKIQITGNDNVPEAQLTAPKGFQLKAGAPFSTRQLSDDRNRISATYLNRGYLNAEVKTSVTRISGDPHRVEITYAITEHQLVHVSKVLYMGQKHTRLSLIQKTAKLPEEAPMKRGQMLAAETGLYDLNIFDWSSVGPRKPITDQTDEDELVKVHEAHRNEITYGFGFEVSHRGGNIPTGTVAVPGLPTIGLGNNQIAPSQSTFASPLGSIEFTRRNMRGLGETASGSILLSRLDQRFLTSYLQPHFFGSGWSSLTGFSLERTTENPLFAASLGDLSFQMEKMISRKTNTRLQLRYDFNKTVLSHLLVPALVLPQDQNIHLSTLSSTLIRDSRDKPLDAHRGIFETLNLAITPGSLGSSASFAKLFGQYAYYKPFHSIVFANSIRLGLAKAFDGSFVPTSQLYFSGGGTSLRGFPIDEAGPQRLVPFCNVLKNQSGCVNVTVPVGGTQLFILNSEVRFPLRIMKNLGGVVFYDGGNVYSAINFPNFVNNYTNTIGIGLRYATPIGPIRIDLGHNLNPVPGINPTQYYITLGQAF
ncbi:MAG: POTRA domain-containing protein [Candidatus Sulfotelmatobacter sp.]|jgi:outer membrane protein assembly factor BamA